MPPTAATRRLPDVDAVSALLECVGRFPKNLRPTLGNRLLARALDVLDDVVRLRYSRDRVQLFAEANLAIEQVRILIRLAFERRLISSGQYARLAEAVDASGRMLGELARAGTAAGCEPTAGAFEISGAALSQWAGTLD